MSDLNKLASEIFTNNVAVGWWSEEDLFFMKQKDKSGKYNKVTATLIASKLALVHSEISEALEGMRKGLMDDHLRYRPMIEVELADAIIRILDLCGYLSLDIEGAVKEKFEYNKDREDHKMINRLSTGGKTI